MHRKISKVMLFLQILVKKFSVFLPSEKPNFLRKKSHICNLQLYEKCQRPLYQAAIDCKLIVGHKYTHMTKYNKPPNSQQFRFYNIFAFAAISRWVRDLEAERLLQGIWVPASPREVERSIPSNRKAIGPDRITSQQISKIPSEVLTRMLNVMLYCGNLAQRLLQSRMALPNVEECKCGRSHSLPPNYRLFASGKNSA